MSILSESRYKKIHTGSAIETRRLQAILEENKIPTIIRDDNESAKMAGYALASLDHSRLLVDKDYLVRAKHLVASTLEDFDQNRIPDEDLEHLSQQKPVIQKVAKDNKQQDMSGPKSSKGLVLFYIAYLLYAGWIFYPMITGAEEFTLWRIVITGGLSVYCMYKLFNYFKTTHH